MDKTAYREMQQEMARRYAQQEPLASPEPGEVIHDSKGRPVYVVAKDGSWRSLRPACKV